MFRGFARVAGLSAVACYASAAIAAEPTAFFEDASIVGGRQTITVTRVPVTNSTGGVTYYDVDLGFAVDAAGHLTLAPDSPVITKSITLKTAHFKAGVYTSAASAPISVAGPGIGGPGGQTAWSLTATTTNCTYPPSATWYTGPITSNPLAARLKKAGITQTQYSYGIVGDGTQCSNYWQAGGLIGAQQVGNKLTLVSFTFNSVDSPVPLTTNPFTLRP